MEPPYSEIRVEKFEASIYREVEVAVKQVRSSRNLNTKIRKSPTTTNILRGYLDFIED